MSPASKHSLVLELLSGHSSELISIWDLSMRLVYATPAHEAYYGKPLPDTLHEFKNFVSLLDREDWIGFIEESIHRKRSTKAIFRLDHSSRCLETAIHPVWNEDGQISYLVVVSKELTDAAYLGEMLRHEIADANPFVLLVLKVDGLQQVHHRLGPAYSEQIIEELILRLTRFTFRGVNLARLHDNELVLLWKGGSARHEIKKSITRLLSMLKVPFIAGHQDITLCASVGISRFPADGRTQEELIRKASIAASVAKDETNTGIRVFSRSMDERISERFSIERDLRRALERNEFELHYQPLVKVGSYRVIGLEALLRWNHPAKGMVPPLKFIPIAEESGFMHDISEWVLQQAARDLSSLNRRYGTDVFVSVNVSAEQFQSDRFLKTVSGVLKEVPIRGDNIKLEITESLLMRDTETAIRLLSTLHEMGIQSYIDDFGTGYSSLSYLKRFPVAGLKIDKSFTAGSLLSAKDKAIVSAMTGLARALDLTVTAEGVETQEQLGLLEQCGCDYFQGYFFSQPVRVESLGEWFIQPDLPVMNEEDFHGSQSRKNEQACRRDAEEILLLHSPCEEGFREKRLCAERREAVESLQGLHA